ncbi:WD40 repeat domain-containing protein [Paraburkholderia sp. SIMBA_049]
MTPPDPTAAGSWPPFIELVQRLREARFSPGPTELVNAGRLLRYLEERGEKLSFDTLRARLRPIFCKSREDQSRFDDAFREWIGQSDASSAKAPPPPCLKLSTWRKLTTFYEKRRQVVWYFAALFVVLGMLGFALTYTPPGPPPPPITDPRRPKLEPPNPAPIPVPQQVERYYPAGRSNIELNTSVAWGGFLLPVAVLLFVCAPAWLLARSQRRQMTDRIRLDERSLHDATQHIVPPLPFDIAAQLERHTRESPTARGTLARRAPLHMRRTIEATMRNFGIPELHFRHTNLRPSYLLLIDAEDEADPRGRLLYMWANRLRLEGLEVDIREFHRREGEAPIAYRLAARGKLNDAAGEPLDRLPDPPVGQRLIVVSDGEAFTGEDRRLLPWVTSARFYRWRNRALFTLIEPQDWGMREESIEQPERASDPGFLVLPLEEDALRAWATLLASGELPNIVLSEPQRYPRLLAEGRYDFLSDTFSNKEIAERLIAQLKLYLGDNGFQWFAALAVTPVVRHPLTLLIGERFFRLANVQRDAEMRYLIARNYRRLARLPWLRRQCMPNWLRLMLLEELPPATQARIREVVRGLLEPLLPTEGAGIVIDLDPLPDTHGAREPARDQSVAIYLGYLGGMSARQLAMRIPEKWASWIRKRPARTPRCQSACRNATNKLRDWLQMAWAELAFRGGMAHNGARSTIWVVVAGLMTCVLILVSAHMGLFLSHEGHPISYVMRGTRVTAYGFSADGKYLLTAGGDGRVQNWNVSTGDRSGNPMQFSSSATRLAFCGQGDTVVTATSNGKIQLWHMSHGEHDGDELSQTGGGVKSVACDERGRLLAVTYDIGTVEIWNLSTREKVASHRFDSTAYAARFVNGADAVIVATSDGVSSWTFARESAHWPLVTWPRAVNDASISLDGSAVIAYDHDAAYLWNLANYSKCCPSTQLPHIIAAAISPDGSQFMIANGRSVQLWSTRASLHKLTSWPSGDGPVTGGSPLSDVGFSPDGRHLVIGDADRATLWTGEKPGFAMSSMDLDAVHGLVSAQMAENPIAPTVLYLLLIVFIVWLNARALRHEVRALSAT